MAWYLLVNVLMRYFSFIFAIVSALDPSAVYAVDRCGALFGARSYRSSEVPLPPLERAEIPDQLLQLIDHHTRLVAVERNMKTPDYIISFQDKNRNFPLEIGQTYFEVSKELVRFFKNDQQLQDLKLEDYEGAAKRVLGWKIINAYSESVNHRAAVEVERYRLYLLKKGVDPTLAPTKWEDVFNQFGYEYIMHAGGPNALMGILKTQKILTRKALNNHEGLGGDGTMIYFGLPESRYREQRLQYEPQGERGNHWDRQLKLGGFIILLPAKALDIFKWSHMNSFWEYGKLDESSFRPMNSLAGFLNFMNKISLDNIMERFHAEIIFKDPIDLRKTDFKILLDPQIKKDFLKDAHKENIPEWILKRIE